MTQTKPRNPTEEVRYLAAPRHLGKLVDGEFSMKVRFMNFTPTIHEVLHLGNGTGGFKKLIATYTQKTKSFGHVPMKRPVIILLDNDDGAGSVFKTIKGNGGPDILLSSKEPFYYLFENLYLVKTPEMDPDPKSCIEDLFHPELFKTEIDGKIFDPRKKHGAAGKYGKFVFAEQVIKPKVDTIDFSGFLPLLNRIAATLQDYETRRLGSAVALT